MDNQKLLVDILSRYSMNMKSLKFNMRKKGIRSEDIDSILEEVNLFPDENRNKYMWNLENIIENVILNKIHISDESLIINEIKSEIEHIYPNIKLNEDNFIKLLRDRRYRNINDMRAFSAICNGDLATYNNYSTSECDLISSYIIKTLILFNLDIKQIEEIYIYLNTLYNEVSYEQSEYKKVLRYDWKFKNNILKSFVEFNEGKKPVFIDGVLSILKSYLDDKTYNEIFAERESTEDKLIVQEINIEDFNIKPDIVNHTEDVVVDETTECEIEGTENYNIQEKIKSNLLEVLELVNKFKEIKESSNDEVEDLKIKNKELEDENIRLRNEIEVLKSRVSSVSLKDFIQKIGGQESEYELTDLYLLSEEILKDDGYIPGRLLNMFNVLIQFNIEPHTFGKKIGDTFEIELKELSQNYNLSTRIKEVEGPIKVELLKYGWRQNKDIIVRPLVKQVF